MRHVGWHDRSSYGRFLQMQHAARRPVEAWAKEACPADIEPPRQTQLIERDLAELGLACSPGDTAFSLPEGADPIGFAWTIAGSSLGNRTILREVESRHGDALPTRFLRDESMTAFWQSLRGRLEQPPEPGELKAAAMAALAVFDHFRAMTSAMMPAGTAR